MMARLSDEVVATGLRELAKLQGGHVPSDRELDQAPVLTGWLIEDMSNGLRRLVGFVTGHPTIPPGWCRTSVLLFVAADGSWARTISRYYRLGEPFSTVQDR